MILLSQKEREAIQAHGEKDFPYECCGLLIGLFDGDGRKVVKDTVPISNAREEAAKRTRFLITPEEFRRGEEEAHARSMEIVGFYHSHPDHPALPSGYDREHAWPMYSYIIVSVMAGAASEMFSWELEEDRTRFRSEDIIVEGEP